MSCDLREPVGLALRLYIHPMVGVFGNAAVEYVVYFRSRGLITEQSSNQSTNKFINPREQFRFLDN
jgi:hypothetical protein